MSYWWVDIYRWHPDPNSGGPYTSHEYIDITPDEYLKQQKENFPKGAMVRIDAFGRSTQEEYEISQKLNDMRWQ